MTIGVFDGVHAGHRAIVELARSLAATAGRVTALAFDPHPAATLRPGRAPARLTSFDRRRELLMQAGVDEVHRLRPTEEFLALSPGDFIEWLVREHAPTHVVEGDDFRFGHGRKGTVETLRALGERAGFQVAIAPAVEVTLDDQTIVRASSTTARWLIAHGRARDAMHVLERPYEIRGTVVEGDRRGRTLGYPTANIQTDLLLPGDGVYAGIAILPDGRREPGAVSVGDKPTFEGCTRTLEIYLMDAPRDGDRIAGLPEYGWALGVELLGWVRDQVRFGSTESLVDQMRRDCARAGAICDRAMAGAAS